MSSTSFSFPPLPTGSDIPNWEPYAEHPMQPPNVVFPNHWSQILSTTLNVVALSLVAGCVARRIKFSSFSFDWLSINWPQLCVLTVFIDSWLFLALTGILVNGVGLSFSQRTCGVGIFLCIFFYVFSKLLIYLFLIERVYIVWGAGKSLGRMQTPVYKICLLVLSLYAGIFVVLLVDHISFVRDDGMCVIGLNIYATTTIMGYDLVFNVLLTSLFLWPLCRGNFNNPRLRSVAQKTFSAAAVALLTSTANFLVLTILHGKELGWVCLSSCSGDVLLNALILYWVTSGSSNSAHDTENSKRSSIAVKTTALRDGRGPSVLLSRHATSFAATKPESDRSKSEQADSSKSMSLGVAVPVLPRASVAEMQPDAAHYPSPESSTSFIESLAGEPQDDLEHRVCRRASMPHIGSDGRLYSDVEGDVIVEDDEKLTSMDERRSDAGTHKEDV